MCVILQKLPNKEIPFEHLIRSGVRNPHGIGVAVADRGHIDFMKTLPKKPEEAAEAITRYLENAKELPAYVHFRYRTVGDVNEANCQPFRVMSPNEGPLDMVFMHNGTLSASYGSDKISDTAEFAAKVVSPLVVRSAKFVGDDVVGDPFVKHLLQDYAGTTSKFVLFDGNGKALVVNKEKGVEQVYGWASNGYSISPTEFELETAKKERRVYQGFAMPDTPDGYTSYSDADPNSRMTVEDITGYDLQEFKKLSPEQVRCLVEDHPDFAAVLILDLVQALPDDSEYEWEYDN